MKSVAARWWATVGPQAFEAGVLLGAACLIAAVLGYGRLAAALLDTGSVAFAISNVVALAGAADLWLEGK